MAHMEEIFVTAPFGPLHVIYSEGTTDEAALVFVPGMLGKAEDWVNDIESFFPRTCVSLSLRGRGRSARPVMGYSIFDHAEDIERVVNHLGLQKIVLVGFSQGALYATAYAIKHPEKIAGLIIQDKALKQKKFGPEWLKRALTHPEYQGQADFLKAIADESLDIDLLKQCQSLQDKPLLVMKGEHSAIMGIEDLQEMKSVFSDIQVMVLPDSGHDVSAPDYDLYLNTIESFLRHLPGKG